MTQKKQVLCGLRVLFLIFNCQTPALIDSFKPFDTNSIAPVTVQVHFLEPIYYEEYQNMKTTEIAKEVKRRIEETISKYEPKEA